MYRRHSCAPESLRRHALSCGYATRSIASLMTAPQLVRHLARLSALSKPAAPAVGGHPWRQANPRNHFRNHSPLSVNTSWQMSRRCLLTVGCQLAVGRTPRGIRPYTICHTSAHHVAYAAIAAPLHHHHGVAVQKAVLRGDKNHGFAIDCQHLPRHEAAASSLAMRRLSLVADGGGIDVRCLQRHLGDRLK